MCGLSGCGLFGLGDLPPGANIIRFLFSARDARDIIPGCLVLACQEHAEGAIVTQTFVTSKQHVPAYLALFNTGIAFQPLCFGGTKCFSPL